MRTTIRSFIVTVLLLLTTPTFAAAQMPTTLPAFRTVDSASTTQLLATGQHKLLEAVSQQFRYRIVSEPEVLFSGQTIPTTIHSLNLLRASDVEVVYLLNDDRGRQQLLIVKRGQRRERPASPVTDSGSTPYMH